jgi:ubiquitin C-terminal hydrolase
MARYVVGPQKDEVLNYKLFAVVHHHGTMGGGHYTATIESDQEVGWFSYNDSVVFPARDKVVFNETAYVLLYKRQDDDPGAEPKLI